MKEEVVTLKESERSFQFKKNYVKMRSKGMSVRDIAKYHHIAETYAYKLIQQLAERLKIPYESLLNRPHCAHIMIGSAEKVHPVKRTDFSDFDKVFLEKVKMYEKTLSHTDKVLKEWPIMPKELGGCE
jgi:hypothetical protein